MLEMYRFPKAVKKALATGSLRYFAPFPCRDSGRCGKFLPREHFPDLVVELLRRLQIVPERFLDHETAPTACGKQPAFLEMDGDLPSNSGASAK